MSFLINQKYVSLTFDGVSLIKNFINFNHSLCVNFLLIDVYQGVRRKRKERKWNKALW